MALISAGAVLVRRASEPDGVEREKVSSGPSTMLVRVIALGVTVAVVTGTVVTGAGPHAGDENAVRLNVEISTVARIHGASVIATLIAAVVLVIRLRASTQDQRHLQSGFTKWLTFAMMQAVIGYVQYFTGVPELLVLAHVTGASLLYVATTQLLLDTSRPAVSLVR